MTCHAEKHGTAWTARRYGCKCPEAIADRRRETKEYRKKRYLNGGEKLRVPRLGTIRRKRALARMGWTEEELGRQMGKRAPVARVRPGIENVSQQTHDWWVAAFDRFSMTEGPSRRAMSIAVTKGWAPPLAWLDLDDPDELPGLTEAAWERTVAQRKVAARQRRNKRKRTMLAAGHPIPKHGPVPTVTQYRRALAKKRASKSGAQRAHRHDKGEAA